MPVSSIQAQFVYYDKKSIQILGGRPLPPKRKAKLSGIVVADVYPFFELTSRTTRLNEKHRVDIEHNHLENLRTGYLESDKGCIKLLEPEYLSENELVGKITDRRNGFKEIARLCDEKWHEVREKCRSPRFRHGTRSVTREQQAEVIRLTTDPKYEDVDYILEGLALN